MTEENKKNAEREVGKLRKTLKYEYLQFVDYYLNGSKPEDAYVLAGLGDESDPENKAKADRLLKSPRVALYIDEMKRTVSEASVITLEAIDKHMTDMALVDVGDIIDIGVTYMTEQDIPITQVGIKTMDELTAAQKACIAAIEPTSGGLKVKFVDKVKLLDMLIKRRGGYKEVVEQNVNNNVRVFAMTGDNGRGPKS